MSTDSASSALCRLMGECEPLTTKRLKREHASSRPSATALAPLRPFLRTLERVAAVHAARAGASAAAPDVPLMPPQLTILVPYCQSSLEFTLSVRHRHLTPSAHSAAAADGDDSIVDLDVSIPTGSAAAATLGGCAASSATALLSAWRGSSSSGSSDGSGSGGSSGGSVTSDPSSVLRVLLALRCAHARRVEARLRALGVPALDALIARAREFVRESDRGIGSMRISAKGSGSNAFRDEDDGASAAAAAAGEDETASSRLQRAVDAWSRVLCADVQCEYDNGAGQVMHDLITFIRQ